MFSGPKSLAILLAVALFATASFCLQICVQQPIDHCGKNKPCSTPQVLTDTGHQSSKVLASEAPVAGESVALLAVAAPESAAGPALIQANPPPLLSLRI